MRSDACFNGAGGKVLSTGLGRPLLRPPYSLSLFYTQTHLFIVSLSITTKNLVVIRVFLHSLTALLLLVLLVLVLLFVIVGCFFLVVVVVAIITSPRIRLRIQSHPRV